MRIVEHSLVPRIKWWIRGSVDTDKLYITVVGSESDLRELVKKIHAECAK